MATRSSGQESLGYGRIEDMVAGLELVGPQGRLSLPGGPELVAHLLGVDDGHAARAGQDLVLDVHVDVVDDLRAVASVPEQDPEVACGGGLRG